MAGDVMDASAYDRERHYLLCDRCGGPVEVGWDTATTACSHCQAPMQVRIRPRAAAAPRKPSTEVERRALLAEQDRRFVPPSELAVLFAGDRLAPSLEREALGRWQRARERLRQGDQSPAEEFFVLSLALGERRFDSGDVAGHRAVVESAIELVTVNEHLQALRCQLARSAARSGSTAAAEAWLSDCDPHSEVLLADTAYRFARAYLETARGDFQAVIRTLGSSRDVPLSEAYASECAVLSAHAWERLQQLPMATDVFLSAMRDLGPIGQRRITRFLSDHTEWRLCPRSRELAGRRAATDTPPVGGFTVAGLMLLSMGLFSLAWLGVAVFAVVEGLTEWMLLVGDLATGAILGLLFTPMGIGAVRRTRAEARRREHGIAHPARILTREIGSSSGWSADITLTLLITPDDTPAYESTIETGVVSSMLDNFRPGRVLIARMGRSPHDYTLDVL